MSIIDFIRRKFQKDERDIVKQLAESYQEKKEKGEEHPIDSTISQIMTLINNSQNPNETAEKMLKAALETKEIPDRIPEKLSIIISKSDKISDSVITNAVNKSDKDVSDQMINNIIEEGEVNQNERLRLIKKFENEGIINSRIENEFYILYKNCRDKRDDEIVERIEEIKKAAAESNSDIDVQSFVSKVIAKKMAENIYDDKKKGTRIYTLSKSIPAEKMFERDIPTEVEMEYLKIEGQEGAKEGRFNKSQLKVQILKQIASNVGEKYKINKTFIIPQSENMKTISEEEEEIFIKAIQNSSGKEQLTDSEIVEIKEEIRGIIKDEQTREIILIDSIKQMENKEKYLEFMTKMVNEEQKMKTMSLLDDYGIVNELVSMPPDLREKAISAIANTLQNRKRNNDDRTQNDLFEDER